MKLSLLIVISILSSSLMAREIDKVIYGDDNRNEVYSYSDKSIAELAKSTVALVKTDKLSRSRNYITVDGTSFATTYSLCREERFRNQPTAAFCSGFLIAPNKIVTAGHCIVSDADCSNTSFLFDYAMINSSTARTRFEKNQVYSCKKVLGQIKEAKGKDFAVIELDRLVTDRKPLKLSTNQNLTERDEIFVIGHPAGLPTKITDGANVREIKTEEGYFVGNLDTFGGNSGSAVFNAKTLEVEGILVRGEKDFELDVYSNCNRSYEVNNYSGRGEDITLISVINENGYNRPVGSGSSRFIWLDNDRTCNEFNGDQFIREVPHSNCDDTAPIYYLWLTSDNTCNEFRSQSFIREVSDSFCGR